jgi:hypothetical protein
MRRQIVVSHPGWQVCPVRYSVSNCNRILDASFSSLESKRDDRLLDRRDLRRLTARLSPGSHDTAKATHESMGAWLANAPAAEVERIGARSHLEKNLAELGDLVQKLAVAE